MDDTLFAIDDIQYENERRSVCKTSYKWIYLCLLTFPSLEKLYDCHYV